MTAGGGGSGLRVTIRERGPGLALEWQARSVLTSRAASSLKRRLHVGPWPNRSRGRICGSSSREPPRNDPNPRRRTRRHVTASSARHGAVSLGNCPAWQAPRGTAWISPCRRVTTSPSPTTSPQSDPGPHPSQPRCRPSVGAFEAGSMGTLRPGAAPDRLGRSDPAEIGDRHPGWRFQDRGRPVARSQTPGDGQEPRPTVTHSAHVRRGAPETGLST